MDTFFKDFVRASGVKVEVVKSHGDEGKDKLIEEGEDDGEAG